jgi:surfeit locus 1 family protein
MMFSLASKVKNQWQLSLLFLLFLPLLLRLGFWQLARADEKQQLMTVYQQQRALPAQKFDFSIPEKITNYQTVIIEGVYDLQRYWLVDNKPRGGKVGYEIVMPLWTGAQWLLINRGWVLAPSLRNQLPVLETPTKKITIEGYFYQPSKNAVLNSNESDLLQEWPKRVLQLDYQMAENALGKPTYPAVFRIADDSPSAFVTDWPMINTLPEKHQAYAVQWFAMAVALLGLYGWALYKEPRIK